jgi:hypothetical protein
MNVNDTRSEAHNSTGSLLVLFQCHIRPASCFEHVEQAGGPAHALGFISFIHIYLLDHQQLPLY